MRSARQLWLILYMKLTARSATTGAISCKPKWRVWKQLDQEASETRRTSNNCNFAVIMAEIKMSKATMMLSITVSYTKRNLLGILSHFMLQLVQGFTKGLGEFVDNFCTHPSNFGQSGKLSHQIFTKPGKVSLVIPCTGHHWELGPRLRECRPNLTTIF